LIQLFFEGIPPVTEVVVAGVLKACKSDEQVIGEQTEDHRVEVVGRDLCPMCQAVRLHGMAMLLTQFKLPEKARSYQASGGAADEDGMVHQIAGGRTIRCLQRGERPERGPLTATAHTEEHHLWLSIRGKLGAPVLQHRESLKAVLLHG